MLVLSPGPSLFLSTWNIERESSELKLHLVFVVVVNVVFYLDYLVSFLLPILFPGSEAVAVYITNGKILHRPEFRIFVF